MVSICRSDTSKARANEEAEVRAGRDTESEGEKENQVICDSLHCYADNQISNYNENKSRIFGSDGYRSG